MVNSITPLEKNYRDRFIPTRDQEVPPSVRFDVKRQYPRDRLITAQEKSYKKALTQALFDQNIHAQSIFAKTEPNNRISTIPKIETPRTEKVPKKNPHIANVYDSMETDQSLNSPIAFDDEGKLYYIYGDKGAILKIKNPNDAHEFNVPNKNFTAVTTLPQLNKFAVGTSEGEVLFFDNERLTPILTLDVADEKICTLHYTATGILFAGTQNGSLRVVEGTMGHPLVAINPGVPITGLSSNTSLLAVGADNAPVKLIDMRSTWLTPTNQSTHGRTVSISPFNPHLLAASIGKVINIFDISGDPIQTDSIAMENDITSFLWNPDQKGFKVTEGRENSLLTCVSFVEKHQAWLGTDNLNFKGEALSAVHMDLNNSFYLTDFDIKRIETKPVEKRVFSNSLKGTSISANSFTSIR